MKECRTKTDKPKRLRLSPQMIWILAVIITATIAQTVIYTINKRHDCNSRFADQTWKIENCKCEHITNINNIPPYKFKFVNDLEQKGFYCYIPQDSKDMSFDCDKCLNWSLKTPCEKGDTNYTLENKTVYNVTRINDACIPLHFNQQGNVNVTISDVKIRRIANLSLANDISGSLIADANGVFACFDITSEYESITVNDKVIKGGNAKITQHTEQVCRPKTYCEALKELCNDNEANTYNCTTKKEGVCVVAEEAKKNNDDSLPTFEKGSN